MKKKLAVPVCEGVRRASFFADELDQLNKGIGLVLDYVSVPDYPRSLEDMITTFLETCPFLKHVFQSDQIKEKNEFQCVLFSLTVIKKFIDGLKSGIEIVEQSFPFFSKEFDIPLTTLQKVLSQHVQDSSVFCEWTKKDLTRGTATALHLRESVFPFTGKIVSGVAAKVLKSGDAVLKKFTVNKTNGVAQQKTESEADKLRSWVSRRLSENVEMTKFNLNAYKYPLSSSSAFIETFLNRMFATRFPDHFTQPLEPQAVAVYLNRKGPFVLPRYVMLMHRYDSFHLMHCRLVKELFHAMNDVKIEQYNSFLEAAKVTVRNAPYSIGDIKPENLFLESVASCSYRIRIGDFGLSECPSLYVLGGTYPGLRVARLIQEILGLGTPSTEGAFEKDYFENLEVRGALKRMVKKDDPLSLELALCYTVCLLLRRENVFEVCKADTRHSAIYEAVCVFCRYFEFKDASNRSQLTLVFEALNNVLLSASFKEQLKTEGPLSANVRFLLGVHFETLSAELQANVIPPKPSHITKSEELIFWLSDTKKAE